jgi:hypothetical protein
MRSIEPGIHFSIFHCCTMDSGSGPSDHPGMTKTDMPRHFRHTSSFPRHELPRFSSKYGPSEIRGRGKCAGRRLRPQPRVQSKKAHELVTTVTPAVPAFPARMVLTAYSKLSPAIGLFVTVPAQCGALSRVDASVEASGPHGFAVRVGVFRQEHLRVHRIPHPRS